jgi:hypothetical protein
MSTRTPFKWSNANFAYNTNPFGTKQSTNPFIWSDVALVEEVVAALLGGGAEQVSGIFTDKKKKKRFITLICKAEGKTSKETKEVIDRKITIKDIKLVAKDILNIDLKINFE